MKNKLFLLPLTILLGACTTYIIPKSSLMDQLGSIDSTVLVNRNVLGPFAMQYEYLANPILSIQCEDKSGQIHTLMNSPSIEVRVTEASKRRTIFYFDRMLIINGQLIGVRSRFAPFADRAIDLDNIELIEIQDGKKDFKYVE